MGSEKVQFSGYDGVTLHGILYLPPSEKPVPGIVMTHGFSAVKEMCLQSFALFLAEAGFAVLLYDHRNLGESGGQPRQEINPWAQMKDYRCALSWLGERSEVDQERLGIWGSSFSGGEVLVLGAVDERVRAVVSDTPLAGMPDVDYADSRASFEAIRDCLLDDSGQGLADRACGRPRPMRVVDDGSSGHPIFLRQPEAREWFLRLGRQSGSTWKNEVTLVNAFDIDPVFDPGSCVAYISPTPLLMVVASEDRLAPTTIALEAFERAREPKQLETFEGNHFSDYEGPGFQQVAAVMRDFLMKHLMDGPNL